jgi:hypothetical protein
MNEALLRKTVEADRVGKRSCTGNVVRENFDMGARGRTYVSTSTTATW